MIRSTRELALAVAALMMTAGVARAGGNTRLVDLPAFSADAATLRAAAAAAPPASGADAVRLLEEARYRVDEHDALEVVHHRIYILASANADSDLHEVQASWAPWRGPRPTIRARVLTAAGAFVDLDPATLTTSPAMPGHVMGGQRAYFGSLPQVGKNAIVEVEYRWAMQPELGPGNGVAAGHDFGADDMPTAWERLVIDVPRRAHLRVEERDLGKVTRRLTRSGGRVVRIYDRGPAGASPPREPYAPPGADVVPHVGFSTARSWAVVARAYAKVIDRQIAAGGVASAGVPVPTGSSRDAIIRRALADLRARVDPTGVPVGVAKPAPWSPADTWQHQKGTSLDCATLLVAMLRAAHISAHVALFVPTTQRDVSTSLPSIAFDRAMVLVAGRKPVWVDPTSPFTRPGELPLPAQGRHALVLAASTRRLIDTPTTTAADNRMTEYRKIFLPDHGLARAVDTTVVSGFYEQTYRGTYAGMKPEALRKQFTDYVRARYDGVLEGYKHTAFADLTGPFTLNLDVSVSRRFQAQIAVTAIDVGADVFDELPPQLLDKRLETQVAARKADIRLPRFSHQLVYVVHIPLGYAVSNLPKSETVRMGAVTLTRRVETTEKLVIVRYLLEQGKLRLSADELRATRKAMLAYRHRPPAQFQLAALVLGELEAGHAARSVQELRAMVAREPKGPVLRMQLARALIELGLREPAVSESRVAVKLQRDGDTLRSLGWILTHGRFGRRYGTGFDRAGAADAYREALKLDPYDLDAMIGLADVLERDCFGQAFQLDLKEPIALYRRYLKIDDSPEVRQRLLRTLAQARRWREARDVAAGVAPNPPRNKVLVAATASARGLDAAVVVAKRLAGGGAGLPAMLAAAAGVTVEARDYRLARQLVQRAAAIAGNTPAMYEKMVKSLVGVSRDPSLAPWTDPRRPVQEMFRRLLERPNAESQIKPLYAPIARTVHRKPPHADAARALRKKAAPWPGAVAADLLLGTSTMTVQQTRWGAIVTTTGQFVPSSSMQSFVTRRGKGWRLIDWAGRPETPAAEALRLLAAGDLEGARTWTDWAIAADGRRRGRTPASVLWDNQPHDRVHIQRVDAILLAETDLARRSVPILDACVADAQSGKACAFGLMLAGHELRDAALLKKGVTGFLGPQPDAKTALPFEAEIATFSGQWTGVERLAHTVLAKSPDDELAEMLLADAITASGKGASANKRLAKVAHAAGASPQARNAWVWHSVVIGKHDDDVLAVAKSVVADADTHGMINSLAAVQAARGEVDDARATLLRALDKDGAPPSLADWLVMGRIAQEVGYPDVARKIYARAKEHDGPTGNYALAQQWLGEIPAR